MVLARTVCIADHPHLIVRHDITQPGQERSPRSLQVRSRHRSEHTHHHRRRHVPQSGAVLRPCGLLGGATQQAGTLSASSHLLLFVCSFVAKFRLQKKLAPEDFLEKTFSEYIGCHPTYMIPLIRAHNYILRDFGPLNCPVRHYIGILVSSPDTAHSFSRLLKVFIFSFCRRPQGTGVLI